MRCVIFSLDAAGALREFERVSSAACPGAVRVVVGRAELPLLLASGRVPASRLLAYSPGRWLLLWLRLLWFLGLSPQAILCTASPHARGMKLLALALRGRVALAHAGGTQESVSLGRFLRLAWRTFGRRQGDVCLVGSASPGRLRLILDDLRRRYPESRIHALLPTGCDLPADSTAGLSARSLVAAGLRQPRFATVVIPCAGEGPNRLKTLAFCLPFGFREIYNENNDVYAAREIHVLLRHLWWRLTETPRRVTVIALARPEEVRRIAADVRRRHPATSCDGILPRKLAGLAPLFDSATVLSPFGGRTYLELASRLFGTRRSGYRVLPWTGNGYRLLKLLFWTLPLGRREVYNENLDCYSGRDFHMLFRHVLWRFGQFARRSGQRLRRALKTLAWRLREGVGEARIALIRIPDGVNVLGAASPARLQAIVADVRKRHPGAPCYGFVPPRLAGCSSLFDSVTLVRPLSPLFWLEVFGRVFVRRAGYSVLPFTREGHTALKLVFWFLPLGRREFYNENYDFCSARDLAVLRHVAWRFQQFAVSAWDRTCAALFRIPSPVNVLAAASPARLQVIVEGVRRRHPGAPCHGFLPPGLAECSTLFDSTTLVRPLSPDFWLAVCGRALGGRRAGYSVLPFTREGYRLLKLLFWTLPLGRREVYNENLDCYSGRDFHMLFRHVLWRFGQFARRSGQRLRRTMNALVWRLREGAEQARITLIRIPDGVNVLGAASPARLQAIVADVRKRHPGAPCHGFVPPRLAECSGLFDSVTLVRPLSPLFWLEVLGRVFVRRAGYSALPFTREGHTALKLVFWFLPLGRREFYNENYDFCSARDLAVLRHVAWRFQQFAVSAWDRTCAALFRIPSPVNVLAAASPARLQVIVEGVRRRHPGAPCHGFVPPRLAGCSNLFDSVTVVRPLSPLFWGAVLGRLFVWRAGYSVLPLTREGYAALKFVFWFLPLGRREFYNENYDFCSARDLAVLPRHLLWRLRNPQRPPRITVVGSASGLFLKKIVADLRKRYPDAPMHAFLPGRLVSPAARLFDSYTPARPFTLGFWRDFSRLAIGRRRSGHLIIPCTNEGLSILKFAGFWMPFGMREVYNENGDCYPARNIRMMVHHIFWRLRHRIFYQALTVRGGRSWPRQLFHLACYPLRLIPGALLLACARARALGNRLRRRAAAGYPPVAAPLPRDSQFKSAQPAVTSHRSGD